MWPAPKFAFPLLTGTRMPPGSPTSTARRCCCRSWSRPRIRAKPVKLVLSVEYGVCKDICIPARADLSLGLTDDGPGRSTHRGGAGEGARRAGARRPGRPVGPRGRAREAGQAGLYRHDPRAFGREACAFRRRAGGLVSLDLAPGRCEPLHRHRGGEAQGCSGTRSPAPHAGCRGKVRRDRSEPRRQRAGRAREKTPFTSSENDRCQFRLENACPRSPSAS